MHSYIFSKVVHWQTQTCNSAQERIYSLSAFLAKETLLVKRKLEKLFSLMWPAFKLRVVLNSGIKIGSLFNFKDNLPFGVRSFVVYKYTCGDCYITYIGKTTRHLLVRMSEHLGISFKTGAVRKYHEKQTTAIREHIRSCKHTGDVSNFSVLANARNDFELLVKESLLIGKEQPVLNKQIKNFQLSLFWIGPTFICCSVCI